MVSKLVCLVPRIVLVLNIIFMNFIIAVISESYEDVMESLIAESNKVRAKLILEREYHFNRG